MLQSFTTPPTISATNINTDLFQYGVLPAERAVLLDPEITVGSACDLAARVNLLFDSTQDDKSPINWWISCYGGDVHGMYALIDYMQMLPMKVNTIGIGAIMSAAVSVLASGTGERSITKNSVVMAHQISGWINGTTSDMNTETIQVKQSQNKLYSLLEQYSNQKAAFWKKKTSTNLYLTAEQSLEYGLVDKIIEYKHPIKK